MALGKKSKNVLIIAVACISLVLVGVVLWFTTAGDQSGFRTVTPYEAINLIKTKKDLLIVDVRGPEELVEGWIEGSVFMPLPEIMQGRMVPPKDRPILLVCAVGGRSFGLGKAMIPYGWTEIYNLENGIAGWKMMGFPLKYR